MKNWRIVMFITETVLKVVSLIISVVKKEKKLGKPTKKRHQDYWDIDEV